jgi:hypothetical protein
MSTKPKGTKKKAAKKTREPAKRASKKKPTKKAIEVAPMLAAGPRRAIFIDVENTSNEGELARVLDELKIDTQHGVTQISAIGNWRTVGQHMGRSLAERGAVLVHSAPAARVRDWSDLWIAVQAGIWLGRARAGDTIEIVSHDKAFDAVGDAAAQLGVSFRRITYRASAVAAAAAASEAREGSGERRGRRRRGGRGGGRNTPVAQRSPQTPIAAPARAPARAPAEHKPMPERAQGASPEQVLATIERLAAASPSKTTTLDALTVALKAAGFHRPPGSPRLVTRLRQLAEVEVLPNGRVRLRDGGESPPSDPVALLEADALPEDGGSIEEPRRRSRRRRKRSRSASAAAEPGAAS